MTFYLVTVQNNKNFKKSQTLILQNFIIKS